jgi:hypothetical protein
MEWSSMPALFFGLPVVYRKIREKYEAPGWGGLFRGQREQEISRLDVRLKE